MAKNLTGYRRSLVEAHEKKLAEVDRYDKLYRHVNKILKVIIKEDPSLFSSSPVWNDSLKTYYIFFNPTPARHASQTTLVLDIEFMENFIVEVSKLSSVPKALEYSPGGWNGYTFYDVKRQNLIDIVKVAVSYIIRTGKVLC